MPISHLKLTKVATIKDFDHLHIGANKNRVKGYINVLRFIDQDTKQLVLYVPSLEISSYGESEPKAREMLTTEIHSFFNYLLDQTPTQIAKILIDLGFKQEKLRHKDFSKQLEDVEGGLKDFNVEGKIERLALVA